MKQIICDICHRLAGSGPSWEFQLQMRYSSEGEPISTSGDLCQECANKLDMLITGVNSTCILKLDVEFVK